MNSLWGAAPLLPPALALAAGIAAAPLLGSAPGWLWGATTAATAASALASALRFHRAATVFFLASMLGLGAVRALSPALPADHIARLPLPPALSLEGRLLEEPVRWAPDRARLRLEAETAADGSGWRPVTGRLQLTLYGEPPPLGEGQRIRVVARLHRPVGFRNPGAFDYPAHLRREGILLVGSAGADSVSPLTADDPPWPVRVKRWAVAAIRSHLPDTSAALLAGLLLGDRTALPPELDEGFRRAGVYHVLAVSGFNVALLAASVFAFLHLLGVGRGWAVPAAAAVLVGFALVVGSQPSVLRATVMGLLLLLGLMLDRQSQLLNALALAAAGLLLWRPGDLLEPGFQLSFAATAGIVWLAPRLAEHLVARHWPRRLAAALAASAGAQLAVTPLMLSHFNQLSLAGVAANLAVVPLAGAATTLGLAAVGAAAASDMAAGWLFGAVWPVLLLLRATVALAASAPWAMTHLPAPGLAAVLAWYAALLLLPGMGGGRRVRWAVAGLLALALGLEALPHLQPGSGRLRITFLDVGQGDAALIELPEGRRILVDGGPGGAHRFDVGGRVVAPFLWNRTVRRLDVVVLSHGDADHAGGLAAVLRHFRVGEFWEAAAQGPGAESARLAVQRSGAVHRMLAAGARVSLGSAFLTVLNPDPADRGPANDRSLVLRLDWGIVSVLLTGDLGAEGENRLLQRRAPLGVLLLKVAHHGSRFATGTAFLDATRPALAVISVGARNPFHHPAPETLGRLATAGARVYRTDLDGAVIVESDGVSLWVTRWASGATERIVLDAESAPPPAPDHGPPDWPPVAA